MSVLLRKRHAHEVLMHAWRQWNNFLYPQEMPFLNKLKCSMVTKHAQICIYYEMIVRLFIFTSPHNHLPTMPFILLHLLEHGAFCRLPPMKWQPWWQGNNTNMDTLFPGYNCSVWLALFSLEVRETIRGGVIGMVRGLGVGVGVDGV